MPPQWAEPPLDWVRRLVSETRPRSAVVAMWVSVAVPPWPRGRLAHTQQQRRGSVGTSEMTLRSAVDSQDARGASAIEAIAPGFAACGADDDLSVEVDDGPAPVIRHQTCVLSLAPNEPKRPGDRCGMCRRRCHESNGATRN